MSKVRAALTVAATVGLAVLVYILQHKKLLGAGVALAATSVYLGSSTLPTVGQTCTGADVTTATFSSRVSGSSAGQTLCLLNGSYGTFNGTNKAVTITAKEGQTGVAFSSLNFGSGDSSFTLTGTATSRLSIDSGTVGGSSGACAAPSNITVAYADFTDTVIFDYMSAPLNFTFDHTTHNNIDVDGGRIRIFNESSPCLGETDDSGVTFQNGTMDGGSGDGIQSFIGFTAKDSIFRNIEEGACGSCHTDAIQFWARGSSLGTVTITGNYFEHNIDGVVCFDGCGPAVIRDNVFRDPILTGVNNRCMELYKDDGSVVEWNTFDDTCGVEVNTKDTARTTTILRNNIIKGPIETGGGSGYATNTNNMVPSGATGGNFNGTATFVGPSSTWAGFKLAGGSAGIGGATDGSNVGVRVP